MEKFTPGPWEVVTLNSFGPFAIRMATPHGTIHRTHYGVGQIGTAANATLIASVPELVEALKALADAARSACDATRHPALIEALSDADAALSRAGVTS